MCTAVQLPVVVKLGKFFVTAVEFDLYKDINSPGERKKGTPAADVSTDDVASQVLPDNPAFATITLDQKSDVPAVDKKVVKFNIMKGCTICIKKKKKNKTRQRNCGGTDIYYKCVCIVCVCDNNSDSNVLFVDKQGRY